MKRVSLTTLLLTVCLMILPVTLFAVQEGQQLIPFKGMDLDGNPIDLSQSIGTKPVVLIFWASWCPSCRTEVPKINQLAEKYRGRGMEFIAVNVGYNDSVGRAQAFARKTKMQYPAYFDGAGTVTAQYNLVGVPTIIVADKHGVVRFRNYMAPDISEATFARLTAD